MAVSGELSSTRGAGVARALAGSWRAPTPTNDTSLEELRLIAPLLLAGGTGPLAWWKLRGTDFGPGFGPDFPPLLELQQEYRFWRVRVADKERETLRLVALLREAGIEPLVYKGCVAARLYPDPGLRPYGDVDMVVAPEAYAGAMDALRGRVSGHTPIDLHRRLRKEATSGGALRQPEESFGELDDMGWAEIIRGSTSLELEDGAVRVLSPEHHLRLLCIHFMKHGGFRALWLCDIAAAVEALPAGFDWSVFLAGDPWRTGCALAAIELAAELLGARVEGTPAANAAPLPRWMPRAVLREWESPERWPGLRPLASSLLLLPWRLPMELRRRWPGALESTVNQRGRFDDSSRFPLQLGEALWKVRQIPRQIARSLADRKRTTPMPKEL